eukprot:6492793-Amphidinium_carterae.1
MLEMRAMPGERIPVQPSAEEIRMHEQSGHLPFRNWCPLCVACKAFTKPHYKADPRDGDQIAVVSLDYGFLNAETESVPMLVVKDNATRMIWATMVPRKGVEDYSVTWLASVFREAGHRRFIAKSDSERSIIALKSAAATRLEGVEVIPQESPKGDWKAHGEIEVAIRDIRRQCRVMLGQIEQKWKCEIERDHPLVSWIPTHAAFLLSRVPVGPDGRTPYERWTGGRKWKRPVAILGESVMWKPIFRVGSDGKNNLGQKFLPGIFMGVNTKNGESNIMTPQGVQRGISIHRLADPARWECEYKEMRGTPWERIPNGHETGMTPEVSTGIPTAQAQVIDVPIPSVVVPRRLYITKDDVRKFGVMLGCGGCQSVMLGKRAQGHTEQCRERIAKRLKESESGSIRLSHAEARRSQAIKVESAAAIRESTSEKRSLEEESEDRGKRAKYNELLQKLQEYDNTINDTTYLGPENIEDLQEDLEIYQKRSAKREAEDGVTKLEKEERIVPDDPENEIVQSTGSSSSSSGAAMQVEHAIAALTHYPGEVATQSKERPVPEQPVIPEEVAQEMEDFLDKNFVAFDDTKEDQPALDVKRVYRARLEELAWLRKREVFEAVPTSVCWERTGKGPVTTKWIDQNKGTNESPNYRSRLVAREIKPNGKRVLAEEDSYSSMPPSEALKVMCSLLASLRYNKSGEALKMKVIDISRAHYYGKARRELYVALPTEFDATQKLCGRLLKSWYGTQDAAACWEAEIVECFTKDCEMVRGVAYPAIFYQREWDLRVLIHGDDIVQLGGESGLASFERCIANRYDYKHCGTIGFGEFDGKILKVLNRVITVNGDVIEYYHDAKHVPIALKNMEMEECRPVSTPRVRHTVEEIMKADAEEQLSAEDTLLFRSTLMRIAFISHDRPDLSEVTKALAQRMRTPKNSDFQDLKHLMRYLKGCPQTAIRFTRQALSSKITVFVDTDFAGCLRTRKSTAGFTAMVNNHLVHHGSNLQSTIALSSGESETYGIVKGVSVGLGLQALLKDWNLVTEVEVLCDSSAARSITSRRGVGRVRHISTRYLWVQEKLADKSFSLRVVKGSDNPADMLTKPLAKPHAMRHMDRMGVAFKDIEMP